MNALLRLSFTFSRLVASEEVPHTDREGITTHHWLWPEQAEIIYGILASVIIFGLLFKFAGPMVKKAMSARTARIQKQLDDAAADKAAAATESAQIRQALGDIGSERDRLMADARAQAEIVLADGRTRLESDVVELNARAAAELESAKGRGSDELRAEISRLSVAAAERAVAESVDAQTHQDLIEAFIQKVGASV